MINIIQISTLLTGGAGIAAHRLHLSLRNSGGVNSSLIQRGYTTPAEEKDAIYTLYPQPTISYKIKNRLSLTPEIRYQKFVKNNTNNSELMSFSETSYRIENTPIVKNTDIVQLHWVANFLNYSTFFKHTRQPIIWTLHDMNPFLGIFHYRGDQNTYNRELGKQDKKELERKIKAIHQHENIHIVSPSHWLRDLSIQSEAFRRYPHYVIPYGLDFVEFPPINRDKVKSDLNINNGKKTILAIAQNINVHRKGGDLLTQAINELDIPCNLITIGGAKLNINARINHIHYKQIDELSTLNEMYSAADLMVLPSREDNLPCVMLESFANGTPILSFSNGGMAEHIETGKTGILLDNISKDSLLNGLVDFLNNKYSFDRDYIRNYAIKNFSSSLQAERYIQLYKNILDIKI